MRRLARFPLLLLWIVALASCGKSGGSGGSADGAFKVGLLTPGPVTDGGWNEGAYKGLMAIRDSIPGAEVSHQQTKGIADIEAGFRDYAARDYQLVFGHGNEYQDAAKAVGAEYPHTIFITSSGNTVAPNVSPIRFELEQATYLCGLMAGLMSKTHKVGCVGGVKLTSVESTFKAFEAGVKAADSNATVVTSYIGNWEDVGAAREATLAQMAQGVDFILHNANNAAPGVFQAAESKPGVRVFGSNDVQHPLAPTVILASATLDAPAAFLTVARRVKAGTFQPGVLRLGLADGIIRLVLNPALEMEIPADVRARIAKAEADIRSGRLKVPTIEG